jgi:glyoxylase-like metal-dependent hydrolase (beta-lactamase superfamily II)
VEIFFYIKYDYNYDLNIRNNEKSATVIIYIKRGRRIMEIVPEIKMLDLDMNMPGNKQVIHPTLLHDDQHAVLVDVGMPGSLEEIKVFMEKAEVPFDHLDAVILTHQDIDHIGSIQEIVEAMDKQIDVYAHAEDQPYIEGDLVPIKMTPEWNAQMLSRLPEDMREAAKAMLPVPVSTKVTKVVSDGDVLQFFGGIHVIFTPGHTPGHISLYHLPSKTLIAGDATVSIEGELLGPKPAATPDMPLALESLKKFTGFDIARVICYHGGLVDDHVNEQFRNLCQSGATGKY